MAEARPYPFDRWPKLRRGEARVGSVLARALATLDARTIEAELTSLLGASVSINVAGATIDDADDAAERAGASVGVIVAMGAHRLVVSLAPGIARVIVDRTLGGRGEDVALGPAPLGRGEAGVVGYVVGRALDRGAVPVDGVLDAQDARTAIAGLGGRLASFAATLAIGTQRGRGALIVPLAAVPAIAPAPRLDPTIVVPAHVDLGEGRLPVRALAALEVGDVIVPDALWLDPRLTPQGAVRLSIARSPRSYDAWLDDRGVSITAARPPASTRTRSAPLPRGPSMSHEPSTTTHPHLTDIEIDVAIELARVSLPLPEVAALAPGVVVTTGRLLGERVAIRAGERVLAWGELVDVEGEVGVRVTEIPPA